MSQQLRIEELARITREPVERLREWQALGLIGAEKGESLGAEDIERARLIQLCLRRGSSIEAIAEADKREGGLLRRYMNILSPGGVGPIYSLSEAAEKVGLDLGLVKRLWEAAGFEAEEPVGEEDIQALRGWKVALDAGLPEQAAIQALRVHADSLWRVAEVETRLFHFYVHERMRASGLAGLELTNATQSARETLQPLLEPAILYFHRKGLIRAVREDLALHLEEDVNPPESLEAGAHLREAIAFVDLSSFTPLVAAMGDIAASEVIERFSEIVRESAGHWDGRVVKQIADAFMLVFPHARSAVACAVEIERRAAGEAHFPAVRSGVHWGAVLYREGDYIGAVVNVAARLATEAEPHQVLVTAEVRREAAGLPDVEFVPMGKRQLKGLAEQIEVYQTRSVGPVETRKVRDPVCGMELQPSEVAARLNLEGRDSPSVPRSACAALWRRLIAIPRRLADGRAQVVRRDVRLHERDYRHGAKVPSQIPAAYRRRGGRTRA